MSDYKMMFELKQNDWISACKENDVLTDTIRRLREEVNGLNADISSSFPWNPTAEGKLPLSPIENALHQYQTACKEIAALKGKG